MITTFHSRTIFRPSRGMLIPLVLLGAIQAFAAPTVTNVAATATVSAGASVDVVITGSGFYKDSAPAPDLKVTLLPSGSGTVSNIHATSDGQMTATFKIGGNASGTINVDVHANNADVTFAWDSGILANDCVEAITTGGCRWRFELDVAGLTGSSTQTNNSTSPNIMFRLDGQIAVNKDGQKLHPDRNATPGAHGVADRLGMHLTFNGGYTQVQTTTMLKPVTTPGSATTPSTGATASSATPCTGTASSASTSATCTSTTPQPAFVVEAGAHLGWTFLQDGQGGTFLEAGLGARGSLQDLVQSNQVVQNNGASYLDLSSLNPRNTIALYEAVGHFRLASHNSPASSKGAYSNTSDLLRIEAGYQYNSGLQQLAANPMVNTKERLVGRFYLFPEIPNSHHTRIPIGLEFSGGINGGPRVIQVVWGGNLNLGKLFASGTGQ